MEASYKKYDKLRKKKGVTNYKVSKDLGLSQTTLSDWKLGKYHLRSINIIYPIAKYFDVSIEDLIA